MKQKAIIDSITIESANGRIINHQIVGEPTLNDLKYGSYNNMTCKSWQDYPIIRVFWHNTNSYLSRFVDKIEYRINQSTDIVIDARQGLSQLSCVAAQRLLDKIAAGNKLCLNGRLSDGQLFCPFTEALPEPNCSNIKQQIQSGFAVDNIVDLEWKKLGANNFDTDCCYKAFKFIYYNDFIDILNSIVAGVVNVGRYVCPKCGKDDIKSKSGYTLHIKNCK